MPFSVRILLSFILVTSCNNFVSLRYCKKSISSIYYLSHLVGKGWDRHLFGLLTVAREDPEFKILPQIFTEPSFTKRLDELTTLNI